MTKQLFFKISSGLKDILGKDLITDDEVAIFELVKNSYDARAKSVIVEFSNISKDNPSIVIKDNGKGMSLDDIKNKWLFVAYSAKRDGTEDIDYRDKINANKAYAGFKGIGRFSCDRLGEQLILTSKKEKDKFESIVYTDWNKFEESLKYNFENIPVEYHSRQNSSNWSGTILEIKSLRTTWSEQKIKKLIKSLGKLLNPSKKNDEFSIDVKAKDFDIDETVTNVIFEELAIKTTKITVSVDKDSISTSLKDGGTLIYEIKEKNTYNLLENLEVEVFYLNQSSKVTFANRMGVSSKDYGSIFLYKNDIRIYPYGEPAFDSFGIDTRKAQKPSIYVGNKDLIGSINIYGPNSEFKETSSRNDGFVKNDTYYQFIDFLSKSVIERIEKYVIGVQKWGDGSYLSIEDNLLTGDMELFKSKVTDLIKNLANTKNLIEIYYEPNILEFFSEKQQESAVGLVKRMMSLAANSNNNEMVSIAEKTKNRLDSILQALNESNKHIDELNTENKEIHKELEEVKSEKLFLASIKSSDLEEILSLMHHVKLSASTVNSYLSGMYGVLNKKDITKEDIIESTEIIKVLLFEIQKILNISSFATKANFKLYTEETYEDIILYTKEYINNILGISKTQAPFIHLLRSDISDFKISFRPIEWNIIIDNLIRNAKNAGAQNIDVSFKSPSKHRIDIIFTDDGKGIEKHRIDKIFDLGHTTTNGSGIGLFHINNIIKEMKGEILVESKLNEWTKFTITFYKKSNEIN